MSKWLGPTPLLWAECERVARRRAGLIEDIERQKRKLRSLRGQLRKCEEELAMLEDAVGLRPIRS